MRTRKRKSANARVRMRSDLPPEEKMRRHVVGFVYTYFHRPYLNLLLHALIRNLNPEIARLVDDFLVRLLAEARKQDIGFNNGAFRDVVRAQLQAGYGIEAMDVALCRRHTE
jgi:hypothetical protein